METIQVNVRVPSDDREILDSLAGSLFSRNDMAAMLLHAAVAAVRENPNALKFPPSFTITDPPSGNALNDAPPKKRTK